MTAPARQQWEMILPLAFYKEAPARCNWRAGSIRKDRQMSDTEATIKRLAQDAIDFLHALDLSEKDTVLVQLASTPLLDLFDEAAEPYTSMAEGDPFKVKLAILAVLLKTGQDAHDEIVREREGK